MLNIASILPAIYSSVPLPPAHSRGAARGQCLSSQISFAAGMTLCGCHARECHDVVVSERVLCLCDDARVSNCPSSHQMSLQLGAIAVRGVRGRCWCSVAGDRLSRPYLCQWFHDSPDYVLGRLRKQIRDCTERKTKKGRPKGKAIAEPKEALGTNGGRSGKSGTRRETGSKERLLEAKWSTRMSMFAAQEEEGNDSTAAAAATVRERKGRRRLLQPKQKRNDRSSDSSSSQSNKALVVLQAERRMAKLRRKDAVEAYAAPTLCLCC